MSRDSVLVTADWAEKSLGAPGVVFVEVDEDTTAYDAGHIPGAVKLDWKKDLQDPVRRDFVNKQQFEALLSERGIAGDDQVVLYGGNNNWFAAYGMRRHRHAATRHRSTARLFVSRVPIGSEVTTGRVCPITPTGS